MGHRSIHTPHLDKLAARSLVFTRGYVASPLCRPSLATMVTGLYPFQHGITFTPTDDLSDVDHDNFVFPSFGRAVFRASLWEPGKCDDVILYDPATHSFLFQSSCIALDVSPLVADLTCQLIKAFWDVFAP